MRPPSIRAQTEEDVQELYEEHSVAEHYIRNRFTWAWSRLLHETQVSILNDIISASGIQIALELAPGPARIASELRGLTSGLMVEASASMITEARRRLAQRRLDGIWTVVPGNAFSLASIGRTFDFVFTFRFVRHFEAGDRKRLYREIATRLNPGGFFVLDVVNRPVRKKLDARKHTIDGELLVFDATYSAREFRAEMRENGFDVEHLHQVIRHIGAQSWASYKLGPRLPSLAWTLTQFLETIPTRAPLEWVAVCRRMR